MINTERLCFGCMSDNGGEKICPVCGYDSASQNPEFALPVKFLVNNRYIAGKMLSVNGEAITYIGWDKVENTVVKIKEYFPQNFAHRNPDKTVSMVKGGEYTFNEGLMEFAEINKNIMNSELPALIPVLSVFEENGTIYAINTNVAGITLERFLQKNGGALKWEQARALFLPLIDTIKGMNDLGIIHRGISTETIIVGRDGKLRISDYSIRKNRIEGTELPATVYAGYAAAEQYGFEGMNDGTYTDVYGLCATLFRVIIGVAPPTATVRLQDDSMTVPAKFAEELPRHVLAALANGLQVLSEKRTRNIEALKNELVYAEISGGAVERRSRPQTAAQQPDNKKNEKKKGGSAAKYLIISAVCTAFVFLILALILIFTVFKGNFFPDKTNSSSSDETSVSAPVIDEIGTIESGAEITAKKYSVPELRGKYYADIAQNREYEMFDIVISDKKLYSDQFPKGTICEQSVKTGTEVVRDTKIELVISLGPKEVKIANVIGLDEVNAKLELLKQGFMYDNIEVLEKYDEDMEPGVVIEQSPNNNTLTSTEAVVKIYVNSYKGEETSENSSYNTVVTE